MSSSVLRRIAEGQQYETLANGLLAAIGNTPLIDLSGLSELPENVRLFAKLEGCNPGASIKDRPVSRILIKGIADGQIKPGRRVLDSSSGNAGISYAMLGAALGLEVTIVVPGNASRERLDRIAAHGAELFTTDPMKGYDFALDEARRLANQYPERYWYADQYSNDNNWLAHYHGTGVEILDQLQEYDQLLPDAFVAGVGTGGTVTGTGRRLKEANPELFIAAVSPERFPGLEGLKPLDQEDDIVPAILDKTLIDEFIPVSLEQALVCAKQLTRMGLFVGPSSGAYLHVAKIIAARRKYRSVVTILSDSGERYGSTGMWQRKTAS